MDTTLVAYVITCLLIALGPALCGRYLFHSTRRFLWLGAATMVVSSLIGGLVGGFAGGFLDGLASATRDVPRGGSPESHSLTYFVLTATTTGIFEEAGRLFSTRRLVGRPSARFTLSDALMFGAGFGGAEAVFRAGGAALAFALSPMKADGSFELSSIGADPLYPIAYASIAAFHITMSVIAAHMLRAGRVSPFYILVLLATYHGAANAGAVMFVRSLADPDLTTLMWLVIAIANSLLCFGLFRGLNT